MKVQQFGNVGQTALPEEGTQLKRQPKPAASVVGGLQHSWLTGQWHAARADETDRAADGAAGQHLVAGTVSLRAKRTQHNPVGTALHHSGQSVGQERVRGEQSLCHTGY